MNEPSAALQRLARQAVAAEAAAGWTADTAARACQRLRAPLAKLAGPAGFAAIMTRALKLARTTAACLDALEVENDGSVRVKGTVASGPEVAAEAWRRGTTLLVTELLALLASLIGEPLTLAVVGEACPDTPAEDVSTRTEDNT